MAAVIIGFDVETIKSTKNYDDEQEGLDKQVIIRFSHILAEDTPKGKTARHFAKLVEDKTNGQVKVHIFPNATLYNETNEWEAIENGSVEMIAPATAKVSNHFPKWQILDLPFAFPSYQSVTEAYEGKIGRILMEEFEGTNVKGMTFWYNGFKQITNNKQPIKLPADFKRLHFRIMPGSIIRKQFDQLHASTSVLPFNKTYQNLKVNFIDGQENTLSNIYTKKFYQHQRYLTISNHGYLGSAVLINKAFWNSLSEEIRENIRLAMDESTDWSRRHSIEINDRHIRELKRTQSMEIHILSKDERKKWHRALKPVYKNMEQIVGRDLMEELYRIQDTFSN